MRGGFGGRWCLKVRRLEERITGWSVRYSKLFFNVLYSRYGRNSNYQRRNYLVDYLDATGSQL